MKLYTLEQYGEVLKIYDSYEKAEHKKYSGDYNGHWDSFVINEWELTEDLPLGSKVYVIMYYDEGEVVDITIDESSKQYYIDDYGEDAILEFIIG